jgi:hemin uptake protein HemP
MNVMNQIPQPIPVTAKLDTYDARDLIKEGSQACIVLDNQTYYLRITRAGKLILTK